MTAKRDGKSPAVVLNEDLMPIRALKGGGVIVLQALGLGETDPPAVAGLGASSREPFMRLKEKLEVWIDDAPVEVLWAGLSPNLAGVYQVKIRLPESGGKTVRLRTAGGWEAKAELPNPPDSGPISEISAEVEPFGVPARPVTWAPLLIAARVRASMTIAPGADPFEIELENEAASLRISVNPAAGTFEGRTLVPTAPSRNFDFSAAGFKTVDYAAGGAQTPGNVIPVSRVPPEYRVALAGLAMPNAPGEAGSVNWPFVFSGRLPLDGRLVLDQLTQGSWLATAAWHPLAADAPSIYRTRFDLNVAGQVVASREVEIPVR